MGRPGILGWERVVHGVGMVRLVRLEAVPFGECQLKERSHIAREEGLWATSEYIYLTVYSVTSHYTRH